VGDLDARSVTAEVELDPADRWTEGARALGHLSDDRVQRRVQPRPGKRFASQGNPDVLRVNPEVLEQPLQSPSNGPPEVGYRRAPPVGRHRGQGLVEPRGVSLPFVENVCGRAPGPLT